MPLKSSHTIVLSASVQRRIHGEQSGDEKWFIRIGRSWGLQVGGREKLSPKNLHGYSFIIKGKVGMPRRTSLSFLSRRVLSPAPPPSWAGKYSCPYIVKLGSQIIVSYVWREYVLGIINLLISLGRLWVSCHHCFVVLGHVPCFCCMVLLLSNPD